MYSVANLKMFILLPQHFSSCVFAEVNSEKYIEALSLEHRI